MEKNEMTFKSVNCRAPYIVDEDGKCLRQLHLTEIVYDLTTGETKLKWIEAETGDFVFGDLSDKRVYASEEQFKKGEELEQAILYGNKSFIDIMRYGISDIRCYNVEGNRHFTWVYQNGVATKFYFDEHISKITTTFGTDGNGERKIKLDTEIPEHYYTAEEVYEFNDYEIVNNDGTKTFHEGICKRLELTYEQNVLVDKLQEAINECIKAKIKLCYDVCNYELNAFNVADIDRVEYNPCPDEDEESYYLNLRNARIVSGVYDINLDDNEFKFVVKKDSIKTSK